MKKDFFIATEGFNTLCCNFPIKQNDILSIMRQTSKNRLLVVHEDGEGKNSIHKVKRSTFFRLCIKKEELKN